MQGNLTLLLHNYAKEKAIDNILFSTIAKVQSYCSIYIYEIHEFSIPEDAETLRLFEIKIHQGPPSYDKTNTDSNVKNTYKIMMDYYK
jgi:hypothetical protein